MKARLLLLALLVAPLLTAQEDPCPTVFPPDACDTSVTGVSPVPDLPLTTGSVACWNLDEASGTRFDDCGSNDLTDAGSSTINVITGRNGNGVQAGPNMCVTGTTIPLGSEWTVNLWFREADHGDNTTSATSGDGFSDGWHVRGLDFEGADIRFILFSPSILCAVPIADWGTPTGGFSMFTAWVGLGDSPKIQCAVNNGPIHFSSGDAPATVPATGVMNASGQNCSFPFGMGTDEISIWSRALSAASRELLLTTFAPF